MIYTYKLQLQLDKNIRTNNIGSVLHGVLMEIFPDHIVHFLHKNNFYNPLKQRIIFDRNMSMWEIVSFHPEIAAVLTEQLKQTETIHIKYHDTYVPIIAKVEETCEVEQLIDTYFKTERPLKRYVKIDVKTPTSFK